MRTRWANRRARDLRETVAVGAWLLLSLCAAAQSPAEAPNLLANPGFEDLRGELPAHWRPFVEPKPGAGADLDHATGRDSGRISARLHVPDPYEKEPANNWSQSVIADLAGKRLRVSGWIRTEGATEATIWAQCCSKAPLTVLQFVSTSDDHPRYGDTDWTHVQADFDVPQGTGFVVVRAVLLGVGTAWFDDLSLAEVAGAPSAPESPKVPIAAPANDATASPAPTPSPAGPAANLRIPPLGEGEVVLDTEMSRMLLDVYEQLLYTLQGLREEQSAMDLRLKAIEERLDAIDRRAGERRVETPRPVRPVQPVPPLVPRRTRDFGRGVAEEDAEP